MKKFWKKGKRLPSGKSTVSILNIWLQAILKAISKLFYGRKRRRTLTLRSKMQTKEFLVERELIYTEET